MAVVVGGVLASHSTLMNTDFDRVRDRASAVAFRDALVAARDHLTALRPDVVLCFGSNHFRGFFLDLLPSFSIGVGEVIGAGEGGTPEGELPTDSALARFLLEHLSSRDIDMAFSIRMTIDHGITHAIQHVSPTPSLPVIPVVINVFAPPLPSLRRCAVLGATIREAIEQYPAGTRVAVIGSGGLSHNLPWPDWRSPATEQDRYLVEAWLNGRADWQRYEVPRRTIIRAAQPDIVPDFDRRFLAALPTRDAFALVEEFSDLDSVAGNGGAEIRNWIAARAVTGPAKVDVLGYWPIDEWLTGMAVTTVTSEIGEAREVSGVGTAVDPHA
jgi:2,3-dihydroxyphenylpropionate 1,2-dioxygenase